MENIEKQIKTTRERIGDAGEDILKIYPPDNSVSRRLERLEILRKTLITLEEQKKELERQLRQLEEEMPEKE